MYGLFCFIGFYRVNETICLRLTKFSGDRRTLLRGRGGKQPTTSMRIIPDDGKTRKQVSAIKDKL